MPAPSPRAAASPALLASEVPWPQSLLRSLSACRFALWPPAWPPARPSPRTAQPSRAQQAPRRQRLRPRHGHVHRLCRRRLRGRTPGSSSTATPRARASRTNASAARWASRPTTAGTKAPSAASPTRSKSIPTPPAACAGSQQALLLRTLNSGIPGYALQRRPAGRPDRQLPRTPPRRHPRRRTPQLHRPRLPAAGRAVGTALRPAVRLPRQPVDGHHRRKTTGFFSSGSSTEVEPYWPGMWIHFRANAHQEHQGRHGLHRRPRRPHGPRLPRPRDRPSSAGGRSACRSPPTAWCTTTPAPASTSSPPPTTSRRSIPYSYTARDFRTYFFDVCNRNDGRTWSTPFVIDDPKLYVVRTPAASTSIVQRQEQQAVRNAQRASSRKSAATPSAKQRETHRHARRRTASRHDAASVVRIALTRQRRPGTVRACRAVESCRWTCLRLGRSLALPRRTRAAPSVAATRATSPRNSRQRTARRLGHELHHLAVAEQEVDLAAGVFGHAVDERRRRASARRR